MAIVNGGVRLGAAVFALGLSLAGPQAAGVASADSGDRGGSAASAGTAGDSGSAPGSRARTAGKGRAHAAASEEPGPPEDSTVDPAVVPDPAEQADPADLPEQPPIKAEGDDALPGKPLVTAGPLQEVPDPAETAVGLTEPPESVKEPVEAAEDSGTTGESGGADPQDASDLDDGAVQEPLPGRGGGKPMPFWRTGTAVEDPGADDSAVPTDPPIEDIALPTKSNEWPAEPPIAIWDGNSDAANQGATCAGPDCGDDGIRYFSTSGVATPSENAPNQRVATLRARIAGAFDRAAAWLGALSGGPLLDRYVGYLSGVLLLIRRSLLAENTPGTGTGDPGTGDSDPGSKKVELPKRLVGLGEDDAVGEAESEGWVVRVVARDGEEFVVTKDYVETRVNLTVNDGVVTDVYVG